MTLTLWIWQVILPVFCVFVLGTMFYFTLRGSGPRPLGPRTYLPRHLTVQQEKRIEFYLFQGRRDWAIKTYADVTGASQDEAAQAIERWSDR